MNSSNRKTIRVVLVQIANRNLGDTVIRDTARLLLYKAMPLWRKKRLSIVDYSCTSGDLDAIRYADAIVFAGGGLIKFRQEQFFRHIVDILNRAEADHIPVFFNAVGVEGYDPEDPRCLMLKQALNLPCVKAISVRDDAETLRRYYIENPAIAVTEVFDPAIWSPVLYPAAERRDVIGLGIAREGLFVDHGVTSVGRTELLAFWKGVVEELERRGKRWVLFTNGATQDEIFIDEVLAYIGHGEKIPRPAESSQLASTISGMSGIIACRMHTNILAYSYGVPSIGLVWNDKLAFWGQKVGYPERFLSPQEMQPILAVERLLAAMNEGCTPLPRAAGRSTLRQLRRFVGTYAKPNNPLTETGTYAQQVVPAALGSKYLKYRQMNSMSTLNASLRSGAKWLECDLRLTADGVPVCVDGWNQSTYNRLSVDAELYGKKGMPLAKFRKAKYYGRYKTATWQDLCQAVADGDCRLLLDIGRPPEKALPALLQQVWETARQAGMSPDRLFVRIQRPTDLTAMREVSSLWKAVYYLPTEEETFSAVTDPQQVATFCAENGISLCSMRPERLTAELAALFREHGIGCVVMNATHNGDTLRALHLGAELVVSTYADPLILQKLTQ